MPKEKVEPAAQEQEQDSTQDSLSQELDKVSTEKGEASAESAEKEAESEGKSKEESEVESEEEVFEDKVTRLAQSIANKTTVTLEKQRNELKARVTELEEQLDDRIWDRDLQGLFNEDVEKLGEDEAKNRKEHREKIATQVKAFNKDKNEVEKARKYYDEALPRLGAIERNQKARDDVWNLLFSEDKDKLAQANKLVEKLKKAEDPDQYEIIFESIKETIKAKKKPFVPDSGKGMSGPKKGRKPTLEELQAASPQETANKVKSGEWALPGWRI